MQISEEKNIRNISDLASQVTLDWFFREIFHQNHGGVNFLGCPWVSGFNFPIQFYDSLDWFKGKFTGNHGFYH